MKIRTISALVFAATLTTSAFSPLSAAPKEASGVGYWASTITVKSWDPLSEAWQHQSISAGAPRALVRSLLGKPRQELTTDVYLYDNCRADQALASGQGCNILIVTFVRDQVADLRFVNAPGAEVIAANLRTHRMNSYAMGSSTMAAGRLAAPAK
jgi:hypothetical protein